MDWEEKEKDRRARENISDEQIRSREAIAKRRVDAQKEAAETRLDFQKEVAETKMDFQKTESRKKEELAKAKLISDRVNALEVTNREIELAHLKGESEVRVQELQQAFYDRKKQIDYEFDTKYRDLDFQEYRLKSREDIIHEQAIIKAQTESSIAKLQAQMIVETEKLARQGQNQRDLIREQLKATLYEIKANLESQITLKEQQHKHELEVLAAKHEYEKEILILKEELRRGAVNISDQDILDALNRVQS